MKKLLVILALGVSMISCSTDEVDTGVKPTTLEITTYFPKWGTSGILKNYNAQDLTGTYQYLIYKEHNQTYEFFPNFNVHNPNVYGSETALRLEEVNNSQIRVLEFQSFTNGVVQYKTPIIASRVTHKETTYHNQTDEYYMIDEIDIEYVSSGVTKKIRVTEKYKSNWVGNYWQIGESGGVVRHSLEWNWKRLN